MATKTYRAIHSLGLADEFGNRLDPEPGDTFEATPAMLAGLREGIDYQDAALPYTEREPVRGGAPVRGAGAG